MTTMRDKKSSSIFLGLLLILVVHQIGFMADSTNFSAYSIAMY